MEAPGGSGGSRGSGGRVRRSVSAPELLMDEASLESLADQALALDATPCSVLPWGSGAAEDDEVTAGLRRTLEAAQREVLDAVKAGALQPRGPADSSGQQAASEEARQHSGGGASSSSAASGAAWPGDAVHRLQQAAPGAAAALQQPAASGAAPEEFMVDEAELAGLSAREREAAIKRAKNREAARRSRERKVERIAALRAEVESLRSNNFVLLKCIEEVARKALAARGEQKQLKDKLAQASSHHQQAPAAAAAPAALAALAAPGSAACTPPAARRAAALEAELLRMEFGEGPGPASPTQLLLPQWPVAAAAAQPVAAPAAGAGAAGGGQHRMPTSAELRRQLQEALGGGGAWEGEPQGRAAADQHHHLHPSPAAAGRAAAATARRLQQPGPWAAAAAAPPFDAALAGPLAAPQPQLQHQAVLHLKGPGLVRTCSAPGGLLAAAGLGVPDASGAAAPPAAAAAGCQQQPWFRGVAA